MNPSIQNNSAPVTSNGHLPPAKTHRMHRDVPRSSAISLTARKTRPWEWLGPSSRPWPLREISRRGRRDEKSMTVVTSRYFSENTSFFPMEIARPTRFENRRRLRQGCQPSESEKFKSNSIDLLIFGFRNNGRRAVGFTQGVALPWRMGKKSFVEHADYESQPGWLPSGTNIHHLRAKHTYTQHTRLRLMWNHMHIYAGGGDLNNWLAWASRLGCLWTKDELWRSGREGGSDNKRSVGRRRTHARRPAVRYFV